MSEFIEKSKHPEMTKMLNDHMMGTGEFDRRAPLPTRKGAEQDADKGKGFNYIDPKDAGHTL